MVCPSCYQDYISECPTGIIINAGLTGDSDYSALITDKFNHKYKIDFGTDADGIGLIPFADLPEGLFTPHSGFFKLEVLDANWDKMQMTINEETYLCIEFEIQGDIYSKQWVGEYTDETVSS